MATKGYDTFLLAPGTTDQISCNVCGTSCTVVRNVTGATNFAEALGEIAQVHDCFTCPHSATAWHTQALRLVEAIESTPSPRTAEQMRLDLEDLIQSNRVGQTVH